MKVTPEEHEMLHEEQPGGSLLPVGLRASRGSLSDTIWTGLGSPGGPAVECLPLAQGLGLGSQDQVLHRAPCMEPASPSASLSVSPMNK